MKKWIQKAIVQKVISYLPWSHNINYIFQKYVTKGVNLSDEYFYDRLLHGKEHIEAYQKYSGLLVPETCLEIGTGWYPIVPISLFLIGSYKIYSVDITFLTSKKHLKTTIDKIIECEKEGKLSDYVNVNPSKWDLFLELNKKFDSLTLDQILSSLNIVYLIEDARKLSLADNSIDLVNSNNTFEHIYPSILAPILKDFRRVVKKDKGVMSHFIDMSDHFAHFDKSINVFNFLRFNEKEWKWIDNSIQPQSRIRITDYQNIYNILNIPITELSFREGSMEELKSIPRAVPFNRLPLEEVVKTHCHFISAINKR